MVLLARNPASYESVVEEIKSSGGLALGIITGLSDIQSVNSAFKKIAAQHPADALTVAVFNSGGVSSWKPFLEFTEDDFSNGLAPAYVRTRFSSVLVIWIHRKCMKSRKLTRFTERVSPILPRALFHFFCRPEKNLSTRLLLSSPAPPRV